MIMSINSSPTGQNGPHLRDDILKCIFVNEKFCILINISLNVVHKVQSNNISAFGSDNGLTPTRRQAIIWTKANPILWRIYAALGGDELSSIDVHG